jgi:hypothetical protein
MPVVMRTHFTDHREIDGVTIPFRVEHQYQNREQVFEIESARTNVAVDPGRFRMPPVAGMDRLQRLQGEWNVAISQRFHRGAPWRESRRVSHIDLLLGGVLLQERFSSTTGHDVLRTVSYDRARGRYRVTEIGEASGRLDVLQGVMDEAGRLEVSNLETGTAARGHAATVHERLVLSDLTDDAFNVEKEISTDGGAEWTVVSRSRYTRAT